MESDNVTKLYGSAPISFLVEVLSSFDEVELDDTVVVAETSVTRERVLKELLVELDMMMWSHALSAHHGFRTGVTAAQNAIERKLRVDQS